MNRTVLSQNITRGYGEFELDVRPPPLFKDYHYKNGSFYFRHLIEPYVIYRRIWGIHDFDRYIRFDYVDAIADTNEIEFGVSNRFLLVAQQRTSAVQQRRKRGPDSGPQPPRSPMKP